MYESTEIAGAGDQAAGALGVGDRPARARCRSCSGPPASSSPSFPRTPPTRGAGARLLPRRAGDLARDGRHALGGGLFSWLRHALDAPYGTLDDEASRWEPGTEGLLFAPYLQGERTPYADPDARGAFVGLSLRHDRGALARATLEGVAYGLRDSLELLRALGVEPRAAAGSPAADRAATLWVKIVASVLGLPLERTETDAGAAFGAALLAGVKEGCSRTRPPPSRGA